jgi:hypothetical protein
VVFWVLTLFSDMAEYQCFGGLYWLILHGEVSGAPNNGIRRQNPEDHDLNIHFRKGKGKVVPVL